MVRRWVTVDDDFRFPQAIIDALNMDFHTPAGVNVRGEFIGIIVTHDEDVADIPDGTLIARLPEGFPL